MPWTKPLHGPARVAAAGKVIAGRKPPTDDLNLDTALSIAGNWRSSHGYPLHVFKTVLRTRAKKVDPRALVFQRQKRLPSIISKLRRFQSMQLSTMQDLGGCRAVIRYISSLDRLVKVYETNSTKAAKFIGKKDYISNPKSDGYRSVHLIYEYQGKSQCGAFCGLKIEIQIRTRLQHAWATALETIDTFTNQALKSGFGSEKWKRFFALMGTVMALREKRPLVPDTPQNYVELIDELKPICKSLHIPDVFYGLSFGVNLVSERASGNSVAHIIELDTEKKSIRVRDYATNEQASEAYIVIEKENLDKPHIQSVLVSVDSIQALKSAYPNYYLDTSHFAKIVNELIMAKK
jgi:hypothetical protein